MGTLHLFSFGFAVIGLILADKEGFAWIRGVKPTLDPVKLHRLHTLMWTGLSLMIVTGLILVFPERESFFSDPVFLAKMLFVGALIANGMLLGRLMHIATRQTFSETSVYDRFALVLSGGVSFLAWASAGVIGYFFL